MIPKSFMSLFTVSGLLLLDGCSPNSVPTPSAAPQQKSSQVQSSPGTRSSGGQASAGAIQNVRQAAKRVGDQSDLHQFAVAYVQYALGSGQGPSNVQELRDSLTSKMVKAFQDDGDYVVHWGIRNPSSNSILAYAKDPDVYGTRLVAKGDGMVVRMSKQEFEQAKSGR
jgi:hypothetical protein